MKIHNRCRSPKKYAVVCLDEDGEACERLVGAVWRICGSILAIVDFSDMEEVSEWVRGQSETEFGVAI